MNVDNTSSFSPKEPYLERYWLFCESILVVLTLSVLYLTACLILHVLNERKTQTRGQKIWQKKWLAWLPIVSSIIFFLRICSDHISAFYGWRDDDSCWVTVTVSTVLFALSLYAVYIFLWVRQSIFYADPLIKEIIKPFVAYVSWFTLGFMLISGSALSILYNVPQATQWVYRATADGCKEVSVDSPEIIPGVVAATTITFQVTLLALFVYPLISRQTARFRASDNKGHFQPSNSLSRSDEHKQNEEEEKDIVFHPSPGSLVHRPQSASVMKEKPISPLVTSEKSRFVFTQSEIKNYVDTDPESGTELVNKDCDSVWSGKSPTIKRGGTMPLNLNRVAKRRTVLDRVKSVKPGSIFFRPKSNSLSSENMESPAASDTESRYSGRGATLKRKAKKENARGRRLVAMMKKYAMLMSVCVITDLVSAVIQIIFVLPELVYLVLFDVNLLVNLICVIMTFQEWQKILFPCAIIESNALNQKNTYKLKRKPTPLKRRRTRDRVEALRQEGRRLESRRSSSRRSSGSGYDSADSTGSHTHIYKHAVETKPLMTTSRV
uniref:uncharacterized protein LOC120345966 n=1 Tax=Styela clava TaxID=7725 RepID=UPI00193A9657|nr:uncharacterized protein LOC120345966 [Styela clava]